VIRPPRTYFHEGDYRFAGSNGLYQYTYDWRVTAGGAQPVSTGRFSVIWNASQTTPELITPDGDTLVHARNDFHWRMDEETTEFELEVRPGATNNAAVVDMVALAPYREDDGSYYYMPFYAGDTGLSNGIYYWRLRGLNPRVNSAFSDWSTFTVDLQDSPAGASTISGDVLYFGKLPVQSNGLELIVEAYTSAGFSGMPEARIVLTNKGPFSVRGLRDGTYYLRAFVDMNGNRRWDSFESYGFVRNVGPYADDYLPAALTVPGNIVGRYIVIRDQDTDNDGLPDAWEYWYCGDLDSTGPGSMPDGYGDYDSDGLSDLQEYELDPIDTNPNNPDTDGDGLSDYDEVYWNGSGDYDPYDPDTNPGGGDLNPLKTDTDGDGILDGDEVNNYGSNPLSGDTDGDGVPDAMEVSNGTGLSTSDSDGDGYADGLEMVLGTDPNSSNAVPNTDTLLDITGIHLGDTDDVIDYDFYSAVTNIYTNVSVTVQSATNLWSEYNNVSGCTQVLTPANWNSGPWSCTNTHGSGETLFYRLKWEVQ